MRYLNVVAATLVMTGCGDSIGPGALSGTYRTVNAAAELRDGTTLYASEIRFKGPGMLERTDYFQPRLVGGETTSGRYVRRDDQLTITYFAGSPAEYRDEGEIVDGLLRITTTFDQTDLETPVAVLLIYIQVPNLTD